MFGRPTFYVPRGSVSFAAEAIRTVGHRGTAGPPRAPAPGAGRRGPVRRPPQAPAAVPARPGRADLRPGQRRRAGRPGERPAALAGGGVRRAARSRSRAPTRSPRSRRALAALDADPAIEVIVLARGGGSVEDLLPFSDETLVRAVAAARTPVVSAIGHEQDSPLVDSVADVRASTPTDAAKLVVPDVAEQQALVDGADPALAAGGGGPARPRAGPRGRPVQPAGAGRPRRGPAPARPAGRRPARPGPPLPAAPAGPGRRRPAAPPGAGARAVPRGDPGARVRRGSARRRQRAA